MSCARDALGLSFTRRFALREALRSLEGFPASFPFLVRLSLLSLESRFLCCFGGLRRPSLLWNDQSASNQIREAFLRQLLVSRLASHVACDDANAAIGRDAPGELVTQPVALLFGQRPG